MALIIQWFNSNLDIVFFIYGLAFTIMGIPILIQPRRESEFEIADKLWLLAFFGITHGLNEHLDMWALIKGKNTVFDIVRWSMLVISYIFLFEFGRGVLRMVLPKISILGKRISGILGWWLSPAITVFIFIFVYLHHNFWEAGVTLTRYFLGLPGSILTGLGFLLYFISKKDILNLLKVKKYFILAAISFLIYGVLGGIIVPKGDFFLARWINTQSFLSVAKIPVQVFRAICAIFLAWAVWNILDIFNWEIKDKLKKSLVDITVSKNYVDNILKSIIGSIIVVNMDKRIKTINPATLTLLGYDKDDLIGMPITNLLAKEYLHISEDINKYKTCTELLKKYSVCDNEILYKTKDGRPIPVLYTCSSIIGKDSQEEGYVINAVDITERKKTEEELRLAYQQLKEAQNQLIQAEKMEIVGRLASGVAHEVKNPLAIILQSVEYLSKKVKADDENVSLMIVDIKESVKRADKIIKGLLDFSGASKLNMNFENLISVIEKSLYLMKSQFLQTHIEVIKNLAEDIPLVKMDTNKIEQAFVDIFINAIQAMPTGGKLTVRTFSKELEKGEKVVVVQVEDTGLGIPEDNLGKIFDPFFTTKQKEGGTGLGLSVVKNIIEQHDGKIEIQNKKEGHGVIAEITFKVL